MRLVLLLGLVIAWSACYAAEASDLQKQDLRAVQRVLKKRDASLDWFLVVAKKAIEADDSVLVVQAAPTEPTGELRPGIPKRIPVHRLTQIAVFVVSGKANQVRLMLDRYPQSDMVANPTIEWATAHATYLHFYADYGAYHGSIKYVYDLASRKPPLKVRYLILALNSSERKDGKLRYTTSSGKIITIEPGAGDAVPGYRIRDAPAGRVAARQPVPLHTADGQTVLIDTETPPGQHQQLSGIAVSSKAGKKQFYPVPVPNLELHRTVLPGKRAPGETGNQIGPFVFDGSRVWFANTFYDGEGHSGVGAVGTFDIPARKYEMRYLPEIVPWSGSAVLLDGENLWIGLMRRPEGSNYGAGLLRYNTGTGAVAKYSVPDLIYTIDSLDGALYCGTSHGLYTIRDEKIRQLRFEPDHKGKLAIVAREVR